MDKLRLGVIFGGKSDEYDVSLHSSANILRAIDEDKYDVTKIGVSQEGSWYITDASLEDIESDNWQAGATPCIFAPDPTIGGVLVASEGAYRTIPLDCVFPVMHGDHVEDGEIQGVFSMAEIPFVGCGVKASANGMDKSAAKDIARQIGVRMADHVLVRTSDMAEDAAGMLESIRCHFDGAMPLFVKPSSAGSSVGVTKVKSYDDLEGAIRNALKYDCKVLVEEAIVGREIEVAVLGNEEPAASCVGEILSGGEFYDYESKYINPESQTRIVDDLPSEVIDEIRQTAIEIFKTLDCRGLSRVDFFYSTEGEIVFNEINTLPGFTNISMYPSLWRHEGLPTTELVDKLIEHAMAEHAAWIRE